MTQEAERRRRPRIRLDGRVPGRATLIADFGLMDVSETTATLEVSVPMAIGSPCHLTFDASDDPLELSGRVTRVDSPSLPGGAYRVSVDLSPLDALERARLLSLVEAGRREPRGV